jgi:hypothetical protein
MIQFDPAYKGSHRVTHFPLIVYGIAQHHNVFVALCIDDGGDLKAFPLEEVNVDWRWDNTKHAFVSIDDAIEG